MDPSKKPHLLLHEKVEQKNISCALTVLYTWMLILIFLKEQLNQTNRMEFSALFFATLNTIFSYAKYEDISIYMQIILALISNVPGSLNFAKNIPLFGSLILGNQDSSDNTIENSNKFSTFLVLTLSSL